MDENRWDNLDGGYDVAYDPRPALDRLGRGDSSAWQELWNELHHQGGVGLASFASVPKLVSIHRERDVPDWNTYALIGCIESCRREGSNLPLPDWLAEEYDSAWAAVVPLACRDLPRAEDETTVRSIIAAVAMAKGVRPLGDLILNYSGDELSEMVAGYQSTSLAQARSFDILQRVIAPVKNVMPPELADYFQRCEFTADDQASYEELSGKARGGTLTDDERNLLDAYLKADSFISLLRLKAARSSPK